MRFEVVRRGGFAGIPVHASIDTADLPPGVAGEVEAAVALLPFGRPPAPPGHPDSFEYQITTDAQDGGRSAVVDEADLPAALRPVVAAALAQGEVG